MNTNKIGRNACRASSCTGPSHGSPLIGRKAKIILEVPGYPESRHTVCGRIVDNLHPADWLRIVTDHGGSVSGPRKAFWIFPRCTVSGADIEEPNKHCLACGKLDATANGKDHA
jgi:hypothetical protein